MSNNYTPEISVALTTATVNVLAINPNRKSLMLMNAAGTDILYFGLNGIALIPIPAGQGILWTERCPMNALVARSAGTSTLVVAEA